MQKGQPSRTTFGAAAHRAAHQVLEGGRIFSDPLALKILGRDADAAVRAAEDDPSRRGMRIFIAVRTRFAEDALTAAVENGARQLVILGAGLDTYAYRSTLLDRLRIFEVDHPATQEWKRECLAEAAISIPESLTYAPVDFEQGTLAKGLADAGFDPSLQTFFFWLGVVPYLTEDGVWSTLQFIAGIAGRSHVVFDYSNPPGSLPPEWRERHDKRAARVAELGEAWLTYFHSKELKSKLFSIGFKEIEDLGPRQIAASFFPDRAAKMPETGGHILRAAKI